MDIKQQITDKILTLYIEGEIDRNTSPILEEHITTLIDENDVNNIVLDFKDVAYISSACLRVLLSTQKKINSLDKTMKIINSNNTVNEIFKLSGFTKYIDIQ